MHQPDDEGSAEKQDSCGDIAGKTFPPIAICREWYAAKRDCAIYQVRDLHYIPPLSQIERIIKHLESLQKQHNREFAVSIHDKFFDLAAVKELQSLHAKKGIKNEVLKEDSWFHNISTKSNQPKDTPPLDLALALTFKSMLHDKGEDYFWPNVKLKTHEIKRVAASHWISDLVLYRITEMLHESDHDIFVFYYNFVDNIENIAHIIRDRHVDGKPKKIIFALNVGKSNGGTYVGTSVVGKQLLSGCHFSMGVYCTEQNALFYGDSQGWPMPDSVEQELK